MIGDNLKRIRMSNKIGLNELARLSGISASYISSLERNEKKNPSMQTLEKLASTLGVDVREIVDDVTNTGNNSLDKYIGKYLDEYMDILENNKSKPTQIIASSSDVRDTFMQCYKNTVGTKYSLSQLAAMSKMLKKLIFEDKPIFLRSFNLENIKMSESEQLDMCKEILEYIDTLSYKYKYRHMKDGEED